MGVASTGRGEAPPRADGGSRKEGPEPAARETSGPCSAAVRDPANTALLVYTVLYGLQTSTRQIHIWRVSHVGRSYGPTRCNLAGCLRGHDKARSGRARRAGEMADRIYGRRPHSGPAKFLESHVRVPDLGHMPDLSILELHDVDIVRPCRLTGRGTGAAGQMGSGKTTYAQTLLAQRPWQRTSPRSGHPLERFRVRWIRLT
jgi:hypothetical protein